MSQNLGLTSDEMIDVIRPFIKNPIDFPDYTGKKSGKFEYDPVVEEQIRIALIRGFSAAVEANNKRIAEQLEPILREVEQLRRDVGRP